MKPSQLRANGSILLIEEVGENRVIALASYTLYNGH